MLNPNLTLNPADQLPNEGEQGTRGFATYAQW